MGAWGSGWEGRILNTHFIYRFGYVEFTTPKQMKKAERELNGAELSGRELKVDVATPRGDGENRGGGGGTPRGRGRGRFCFYS